MDSVNIAVGVFVFIIGLCIGSFLNVVILRALSGESIVFPASKCPTCQTPLKWWHNIPVISYILLKGECGFCKEHISLQYPIVELLTGYLFLMTFVKYGYSFNTLFIFMFLAMFIVISTTDIKEHVAFDLHSYILCAFGVIYNFFNLGFLYEGHTWIFNTSFIASILGILVGAGIIGIYYGLGYLFFKTMIIGTGDIYIAGALGACFGWKYIIPILIGAVALQVLFFIPAFIKKLIKKNDYRTIIAFGSFVAIALINYLYLISKASIFAISVVLNILLIGVGIWLAKRVIATLPENLIELNEAMINDTMNGELETSENDEIFHLPFGPALCCAAVFFIFLH